jgi:hypothetical protein
MKQFAVMGGVGYTPRGGLLDLCGTEDTLEEALEVVRGLKKQYKLDFQWWHIADLKTGELVLSSTNTSYGGSQQENYHKVSVCTNTLFVPHF